MNKDRIIDQVMALAPDIPGYQIGAYMLELLESIRSEGISSRRSLSATGYSVPIPSSTITIYDIYVNGELLPQDMTESEVISEEGIDTIPADLGLWTDEDEFYLADEDGTYIVFDDSETLT